MSPVITLIFCLLLFFVLTLSSHTINSAFPSNPPVHIKRREPIPMDQLPPM